MVVPEARVVGIDIVDHLVVVPVVIRYWPVVPVVPNESVRAPFTVTSNSVALVPTVRLVVLALLRYV